MPDDLALEILQRCDGTTDVAAIAAALAAKYAAPQEEVEHDIIEMLQDLADKGGVAA